jgi:hypothetical protein
MFKRILYAMTVVGALTIGFGMPQVASADRGHGHYGHHGHHGHHHHGHWHGHGHWHRPIVYPPIYVGGYYPVRTYYANPYWGPYYGGYYARPYGYYGSGVSVSFGW